VILEAGDRSPLARHELRLQQYIADHPAFTRERLVREEPDARHRVAVAAEIAAAEELVAAADGQDGGTAVDRRRDVHPLAHEVGRDQRLLPILAAADVEQVVLPRPDVVADRDRLHLELMPSQRRAAAQHRDVPAVGVDVQVLGVEMPDADPHARSQYGVDQPRSTTSRWSSSIAV
jgi:hypothetical protein